VFRVRNPSENRDNARLRYVLREMRVRIVSSVKFLSS
jgi:hypothetical protein